ncbi:MAG: LacI family DNA-binding transcriptional regulator [Armatimonadetes bacterium]|nr:LacI family DNA-binding transcriptional regulator [Armatimonadota bacterium]
MARKATSVDVARLAGVSQATVSYVLNGRVDQSIREETRSRVLDAARELGYQANLAARALVTGRTQMIALWVPYAFHSVFGHIVEQVMGQARGSDYRILVVQIYDETPQTMLTGALRATLQVDGILAFDAFGLAESMLDAAPHLPPLVTFGPTWSPRTDHVGVDLGGGSVTAVRHLLARGCRRVAFAGFADRLWPGEARYDAYLRVLGEAGLEPCVIPLERGDYDDSYRAVRDWFAADRAVDGLFCWNDEAAIGAVRALADLGVRVPDDVAVIGSDGVRETAFTSPTLSTMAQPFAAMCELAWNYLRQRLDQPDLPLQQTVLPMDLVERASTERV